MGKYMMMFGGVDLDRRHDAALAARTFEQFTKWIDTLRASGHFIQSHRLRDQTGARLSVRGGQVVEGPFMETKEAVGGVLMIESPSLEEAVKLARGCPLLELGNGYVEVRVVDRSTVHPGPA